MPHICNLLIADGDFDQVILIESLLQTLGKQHQCHQTPNGSLTLQFLRREPPYQDAPRPDLILLDLYLSEGRGCEVLRTIKSHADLRSIPVIIVCAARNEVDVNACYDQHANAVVNRAADLDGAVRVVSAIEQFWLQLAELPSSPA